LGRAKGFGGRPPQYFLFGKPPIDKKNASNYLDPAESRIASVPNLAAVNHRDRNSHVVLCVDKLQISYFAEG
jgi:hypothetical protein